MADRGILFSAPMVRALWDGRKTQTRRMCKPANDAALSFVVPIDVPSRPGWFGDEEGDLTFFAGYTPGDRLWVREAWRVHRAYDDLKPSELGGEERVWPELDRDNCDAHGRYRHGRFMPRWASRLTLVVTAVRVEPLNDCSEADAQAEGLVQAWEGYSLDRAGRCWGPTAKAAYAHLWDSINGEDSWDANPWVVAVSFDVHRANIDNLGVPL